MKKLLSALLAACLLLTSLPAAYAQGGEFNDYKPTTGSCGPNASYVFEDGVLTISGTGPVTELLAGDSFPGPFTAIVIEEGITALLPEAFGAFNPNITRVELPAGLRYIDRLAFNSTGWLEAQTDEFVIVGDGVLLKYNGEGGKVTVPDTVKHIQCNAFDGTGVTELAVGGGTYMGGLIWPVGGCETITCGGKELGPRDHSPWLITETEDPVSGSTIHRSFLVMDHTLLSCGGSVGEVTVPNGVTAIAPGGLWGPFTGITVPEAVTELAPHALGVSTSWTEITLPIPLRGAADSAVQKYAETAPEDMFRFIPFGEGSLSNFTDQQAFTSGQFKDVTEDQWFHAPIASAYRMKLMNGKSDDRFDPDGQIKLCEAVTIAVRVRDTYYYEQTDFSGSGAWYQPYIDYALAHEMLAAAPTDPERPATRAELASLLAAALPERELEAVHDEIIFTDLPEDHPAYAAAMAMAQAGVMQGKGEGVFDPDAPVKRSEAAAMLSRCVQPGLRIRPQGD